MRSGKCKETRMTSTTLDAPKIRRERLPLVRRELKVIEKFCPTPNLIRVVLAGEELDEPRHVHDDLCA